jgi:hypothetical protein
MMKWMKAGLALVGLIIVVTVADLYWTTSGDYMKLSGFSILGWSAVFAVLFFLLKRNFFRALGVILIFTAVEDFIYNAFVAAQSHTALLPMHVNFDAYKLYGAWATGFGQIWFGFKAVYVLEVVLGTLFILAGDRQVREKVRRFFTRTRVNRRSSLDSVLSSDPSA